MAVARRTTFGVDAQRPRHHHRRESTHIADKLASWRAEHGWRTAERDRRWHEWDFTVNW